MIKGKSPGVADLDSPKPKGEYIGVVGVPGKEHFIMQESVSSLSAGDGICYYDGKELKGAGINKVLGDKIYLNKNVILKKGWKIYRNYDHKFFKILEQDRVRRKLGISILAELSMNNVAIEVVTESGFLFKLNYPGRYNKSQNSAKTEEAVKTQFRKSGNTIFLVTNVEVVSENEEEIPFLTIADLNNMRRESFDKLLGYLVEHENKKAGKKDLPAENMDFPFPSPNIKGDANVVNSLARKFYADHEVKSIEEGFDTRDKTHGLTVMTSSYCIRREMDLCLKNHKARLHKELYLRHGKYKYLLDFDCKNCNMKLINITSDDRP